MTIKCARCGEIDKASVQFIQKSMSLTHVCNDCMAAFSLYSLNMGLINMSSLREFISNFIPVLNEQILSK